MKAGPWVATWCALIGLEVAAAAMPTPIGGEETTVLEISAARRLWGPSWHGQALGAARSTLDRMLPPARPLATRVVAGGTRVPLASLASDRLRQSLLRGLYRGALARYALAPSLLLLAAILLDGVGRRTGGATARHRALVFGVATRSLVAWAASGPLLLLWPGVLWPLVPVAWCAALPALGWLWARNFQSL